MSSKGKSMAELPDTGGTDGSDRLLEELRLCKSKLRTLLRLSEDLIVVLDKKGVVIEIGTRAAEVFGINPDEIAGRMTWDNFVPDDEHERLLGYFSDRLSGAGNPPSTYTLRLKVPDGQRFMRANVAFIPGTEDRIIVMKDLSEVVREQRRTAESEERHRKVIENTMDGILICTSDMILFANKSFCDMTELPREDIYTMTPMRFFSDSDRDKINSLFAPSSSGEKKTHLFEAGVRKRRGLLPAELSAITMTYRDTDAVLISVRDLSQRKEAEKKLKDSHKLLKAIVDNSPVGVSVHDRFGTLLLANASWRTIWGKTIEDLEEKMVPRKKLRMDRRDSYLGKHIQDVERVYTDGGELYIPILEIPNPPPGGAEYISHHFYALMDDKGEVDKVVILTLDLTESLKTQDELIETRDLYYELFSNIPVAVYRTTLETGGRIVSANPEMLRMFRAGTLEELERISVRDLYVDSSRRIDLMEGLQENKEIQGFEAELRRADGSTFLGSISAREVSAKDGEVSFIEGIIRDITDQRRMEEELQNIEHLESIGTLAGGIAHDFNNLLMAIQGGISLAQQEDDAECIRRHLEETDAAIEEATVLTRQLLTFARGGVPFKETVDVESCVRDSIMFSLRGSEVEPEFEFQDDLYNLEADREQIAQVLQNLAVNSVQAMPGEGILHVSVSNIVLGPDNEEQLPPGRYVRLSIRDTGEGIPAKDLKRIFNPYFTTKPDGTGLGLATSYSIIKRHSGSIRVISDEGEGTEFIICLPSAAREIQGSPCEEEEGSDTASDVSASILIMDDDTKVRRVLASMLDALGHNVTECSDGKKAVEMYRESVSAGDSFDLVIMDLTVPGGMGGEKAIRELIKIDPSVKAIVSSGYANNPVLSGYRDYGFSGSLVKPYSLVVLRRELNSVLSTNL
jgi:PAS domain S-box-containing protein